MGSKDDGLTQSPDICITPCISPPVIERRGLLLPSRQKSSMDATTPLGNLKSNSASKIFNLNLMGMKKMQSTKNVIQIDGRAKPKLEDIKLEVSDDSELS